MSVTSNRSYCFCCGNCSGPQQHSEFQKIVDLKDLGLSLYRYVIYPRSYRRDAANLCGANIQSVDPNEIFIFHNTRNNEISPADYVLALDRNPIYCLRCRQAVLRAKRLLEHGETIGKKSVKGICEHCLSRQAHLQFHQPCVECQEVVKRFAERLAINSALRSAALDASLKRKRQPQPKSRPSLQRDPKIEQMFLSPEDKYDERASILSELRGYGSKKRSTLELSGGPVEPIGKQIVTFGEIPEIIEGKKLTLFESIANTDDHDVEQLLNYIKSALKEKEDEAGTQIPYAKWVIGKTDEELEKIILQAISFARKDSDIERHILQLIDAQETANSNLSEMKNRLQDSNIKLQITEPISEVTKRTKGSLEKLVHHKVMEEKGQVIKEARDVALLIRKQLDAQRRKSINILGTNEYLKQERHMPPKSVKSEEDITRFTTLLRTKLQNAKKDQESKENLPPISHKLFRQKFEAAVDSDLAATAHERDLYSKSPGVLKPSHKGAQILQKSFSDALDTKDDQTGDLAATAHERDLYSKTPGVLKPSRKGAQILQKSISDALDTKDDQTEGDDKKMDQTKKPEEYSEQMKEQKDKTYITKTVASEKEMKQKKDKGEIRDKYQIIKTDDKKMEQTKEPEKYSEQMKEQKNKTFITKTVAPEKEMKGKKEQIGKKSSPKTIPSEKEIKGRREQKDETYVTKTFATKKEIKEAKKEIEEAKKRNEQKDNLTKSITSEKEREATPTKKTSKKEKAERLKIESPKSKEAVSVKSKPKIRDNNEERRGLKELPEKHKVRVVEEETAEMKAENERQQEKDKRKNIILVSEKLMKKLEKKKEAIRKEKEKQKAREAKEPTDEGDKEVVPIDTIVKKINKLLTKQDKEEKKALKMKNKLQMKEAKFKSKAHNKFVETKKRLDAYVELPEISSPPHRPSLYSGPIVKAETGEQFIQLPYKSIRLKSPSIDDLILRLVKIRKSRFFKKGRDASTRALLEAMIERERLKRKFKRDNEDSDLDSDYYLDVESFMAEKPKEKNDIIVGTEILNPTEAANYRTLKREETEPVPTVFKTKFDVPFEEETKSIGPLSTISDHPLKDKSGQSRNKTRPTEIKEDAPGVLRYKLSDKNFIDNGWTQLPTQKIFRRINLYRMRPAHPEFDWFKHNKSKGYLLYDTKELLAVVDDNGHGRWFYRNGNIALEFYNAEELNATQRIIIYSTGESDKGCDKGHSQPVTVLGSFDYCGNGIVLDHSGEIRLKYNQAEGLILDKTIGPISHWKWHDLNEPPKFQQVYVESKEKVRDPVIHQLSKIHEINDSHNKEDTFDEERTAIEYENSVKEKLKAITSSGRKFKPFPIRMKVVKINEHFTLRVLDQANIYIMFRDGSTNLKLNIGMNLDPCEIVDMEFLEVKPHFESHLEKFPALSTSIQNLQNNIARTKKASHAANCREKRLQPKLPSDSMDKFGAFLSQPLNSPISDLTATTAICSECDCKSNTLC